MSEHILNVYGQLSFQTREYRLHMLTIFQICVSSSTLLPIRIPASFSQGCCQDFRNTEVMCHFKGLINTTHTGKLSQHSTEDKSHVKITNVHVRFLLFHNHLHPVKQTEEKRNTAVWRSVRYVFSQISVLCNLFTKNITNISFLCLSCVSPVL